MSKPAARITDAVAHPLPPLLTGEPGSPNVLIGYLPAWQGIPLASAGAILSAKALSETGIKAAEAATRAAAATQDCQQLKWLKKQRKQRLRQP
jgi:hypothetical protein